MVAETQVNREPMKLLLERHPPGVTCTIGELSIDGMPFTFTLEDLPQKTKIPGKTRIPAGTYEVEITWSGRFKRDLPLLKDVPGFTGIRIHAGNTEADTSGCILVGSWRGGEELHSSRDAMESLMDMLEIASISKRNVTIEVKDHDS